MARELPQLLGANGLNAMNRRATTVAANQETGPAEAAGAAEAGAAVVVATAAEEKAAAKVPEREANLAVKIEAEAAEPVEPADRAGLIRGGNRAADPADPGSQPPIRPKPPNQCRAMNPILDGCWSPRQRKSR